MGSVELKFFDRANLDTICRTVISNRLYVPGWYIRDCVTSEYIKPCIAGATFAYYDGTPIGLLLLTHTRYDAELYNMQFFVRVSHRRQGVATKMFNFTKSKFPNAQFADLGDGMIGSRKFFNSLQHHA